MGVLLFLWVVRGLVAAVERVVVVVGFGGGRTYKAHKGQSPSTFSSLSPSVGCSSTPSICPRHRHVQDSFFFCCCCLLLFCFVFLFFRFFFCSLEGYRDVVVAFPFACGLAWAVGDEERLAGVPERVPPPDDEVGEEVGRKKRLFFFGGVVVGVIVSSSS